MFLSKHPTDSILWIFAHLNRKQNQKTQGGGKGIIKHGKVFAQLLCLQSKLSNQMGENRKFFMPLLLAWLICSGNTVNWQGTGNFSQDNMTIIWNYFDSSFNKSKTNDDVLNNEKAYLSDFATSYSTYLNGQWKEAWNVVVLYIPGPSTSDSVLYGYAFRDHWMWYNGIPMNDANLISLVIWKDYNCQTWTTFNSIIDPSYNFQNNEWNHVTLAVDDQQYNTDLSDIWKSAKRYVQNVQNRLGGAFSVILTQTDSAKHFGRFCAKGYLIMSGLVNYGSGYVMFLQMR